MPFTTCVRQGTRVAVTAAMRRHPFVMPNSGQFERIQTASVGASASGDGK
jgi:hypothetical protein